MRLTILALLTLGVITSIVWHNQPAPSSDADDALFLPANLLAHATVSRSSPEVFRNADIALLTNLTEEQGIQIKDPKVDPQHVLQQMQLNQESGYRSHN